ncbi:hypothetical protein BGZ58_002620 [Dissophora ornata]|nr:hypothetical protein BGZ58_002620 [Dissophora ornata]
MSDQAELLRKRREARQKKILASGESRLSKITGTAGTSTQVAPSPAVLHAREQLLKKEQEEERLKALKAAGGDLSNTDNTAQGQQLDNEEEELVMPSSPSQHATADRIARQRSASSAHNATNNTTSTTNAGARTGPTTVEDANDADPDDSLGAPPTHVPLPFGSNNSQQNPFMNNMFNSPQHQQALTRMMQEDNSNNGSNNVAATQNPFGNAPPGFTVITPQVDQTARWWKLLHFIMSALFGLTVVYSEHSRHGDFGRFDALATDKPLPYGVYQVAPIVRVLPVLSVKCSLIISWD